MSDPAPSADDDSQQASSQQQDLSQLFNPLFGPSMTPTVTNNGFIPHSIYYSTDPTSSMCTSTISGSIDKKRDAVVRRIITNTSQNQLYLGHGAYTTLKPMDDPSDLDVKHTSSPLKDMVDDAIKRVSGSKWWYDGDDD